MCHRAGRFFKFVCLLGCLVLYLYLKVSRQLSDISCQIGQLSDRTTVISDNCLCGRLSVRTTVSGDNCQWRQLSVETTVSGDNCQWGQLSVGQLSVETVSAFLALRQL